MAIGAPRRRAALLALLCVLAGCKASQERSVSLSEIANPIPSSVGRRVRTTATVTYSDPEWRLLFVQDEHAAIYLTPPPGSDARPGDRVQIIGNLLSGGQLSAASVLVISRNSPLPSPTKVDEYSLLPAFFSQVIQVSGVVEWAGFRNGRPMVEVSAGQNELDVYFRNGIGEELPFVGSEVKITGVAAADFDGNGRFRGSKLFSPSVQQVQVLKVGPKDPFTTPIKQLSEIKDLPPGTLVHTAGELEFAITPSISDGSSSVALAFADSVSTVSGASDVVGFWNGVAIKNAIVRPVGHQFTQTGDIVHLTELKHLDFAAASTRRRVNVRATVTYVDADWGVLFVQDDTAAAYVNAHGLNLHLQPGDLVDIAGVSGPGGYAPQIEQPQIGFVRRSHLPEPLKIDLAQGNLQAADSKWCSLHGVVHVAEERDGHTILRLGAGQSDISVQLPILIHSETLVDREVSITGVLGVLFNDRRQAVGHQLFVPSLQFVKVTDSGPIQTDPVTIGSLQRYNPDTDQRHGVTLRGAVVLKSDSRTIFIQDKTAGIEVRGAGPLEVSDGDNVVVRGFVINGDYSPVLEHAVVTSRSVGSLPSPSLITIQAALDGHYDSEYVAVRSRLAAIRSSSNQTVLSLNDKGTFFEATGPANTELNALRPGSEIEIRGVCRVLVDRTRFVVNGFNLTFDSPQAIVVLHPGPWLDGRKISWLFLGIAVLCALASLWIVLLRQKVETRTSELQSSVDAKRKAQQFDAARNQVLEAIARNAPPPESMELLALAVQEQIEGSICAIAMSPDGKSFLNGKPSAVLIAPSLPEDLQRKMLPVLSSVLVGTAEPFESLRNDNDVMASVMEIARNSGIDFCDGEVAVAFSGAGDLAGLLMVFFQGITPADADNVTRVLQSASRLVSLARDHWHMHERLVFDARHDALTGLPNRTVAEDRLEQALARAQRRRQMFAVLCIDLDGFKAVNDTLGHGAGDELLRVVATRLRARIRHSDTLARIGGDEFFAIIEDCSGDDAAQRVGDSLISTLQEPILLEGKMVSISGSIGIALYPTDGRHANELKRNGDQAMYRAKAAGRGRTCFWSGEPTTKAKAVPTSSATS